MQKPVKDKELTKRRLIAAVGTTLREHGYRSLGINRVARTAGVDKRLIYRYFGSFNDLVEAYVVEKDYWMRFSEQLSDLVVPRNLEEMRQFVVTILKDQFTYFHAEKEMQELLLWELSGSSDLMRSIHRTRELMGNQFFGMTDQYIQHDRVKFRAIAALVVGGIYYMILHSRANGGTFTDVNLNSTDGRHDILDAIESIIGFALEPK